MDYFIVVYRTLVFYIIITIIYRFMGKREIGQLGIVDLIVSILIAELAAISIDNREESIFLSIVPMIILALIEIGIAFLSLKSQKIRNLFDGEPSVIINSGKINFKEMVKQRYNLDDLMTQLREFGVKSIEEVDYAVLETSGKLSIFNRELKMDGEYPIPLILDGKINYNTLKQIRKSKKWVDNILSNEKVNIENVFYAFYRKNQLYIIKSRDLI